MYKNGYEIIVSLQPYQLLLTEMFTYYLNKYLTTLMAPLYYHFGNNWFFLEFVSVTQDLVDTVGLYFLVFIFVISVVFYRNYLFQVLNKSFFKNYLKNFNILPLSNYLSFFFNSFKKVNTFLSSIYFFFFKKK